MDPAHHMLGTLPPAQWPLTQTGLTPYLMIDDDNTEPDVFASSFAGQPQPPQHKSITGLKHDLSPGAASTVVQSHHLKRPKLPSTDVSSSTLSTVAPSTDSSDSPPSDAGDGKPESGPPLALLPHAPPPPMGKPTNAPPNVVLSSQDFATLMQGYAAGTQAFHQQAAPSTTLNSSKLLSARRTSGSRAPSTAVDAVKAVAPAVVAPSGPLPTSGATCPPHAADGHPHRAAAPSRLIEPSDEDEPPPPPKTAPAATNAKRSHTAVVNTRKKGKATAPPAVAPAAAVAPDDPQEEKRAQFLERNRVAACKSRQKKKEWVQSLEHSADALNRRNSELQQIVHSQQDEIAYLRNILAMHEGCGGADGHAPATANLPVVNAQTGAPVRSAKPGLSAGSPTNASFSPPASAVAQMSFVDQLAVPAPDASRPAFDHSPSVIPFNVAQHNLSSYDYFTNVGVGATSQSFSTPDLATSLGFGAV